MGSKPIIAPSSVPLCQTHALRPQSASQHACGEEQCFVFVFTHMPCARNQPGDSTCPALGCQWQRLPPISVRLFLETGNQRASDHSSARAMPGAAVPRRAARVSARPQVPCGQYTGWLLHLYPLHSTSSLLLIRDGLFPWFFAGMIPLTSVAFLCVFVTTSWSGDLGFTSCHLHPTGSAGSCRRRRR